MGGGLLQLVAYGAQDVYITGNPQVTFFKLVYRRHTNFSMETIEQTFNGNPDFGRKVTCTLSRNGDLVHKIWLMVTLKKVTVPKDHKFRWLNYLGHLMIDWVEFEIGGQKIDKQMGEWMQIYTELTIKAGHSAGYASMIGNIPSMTNMAYSSSGSTDVDGMTLYIPLQFYFCRNPGLAVPLVALQYHEVKINISFRQVSDCIFHSSPSNSTDPFTAPSFESASLLVDYVFLDSDERRRFAQVTHEYLITQIQHTGDDVGEAVNKIKLTFNHPTKEIVWVSVDESYVNNTISTGNQWFNFSTEEDFTYLTGTGLDGQGIGFGALDVTTEVSLSNLWNASSCNFKDVGGKAYKAGKNPTTSCKLVLNGHDRFAQRDGRWFNLAVPYACHENIPPTGINVYSFGLKPEEHQPSGTINFSRIDTAMLHLSLDTKGSGTTSKKYKIKIYAVSYNILRIMSGMGGLAYSN